MFVAFDSGVASFGVLLYLATVVQSPEAFAVRIYMTVLAFAAAVVGAVLPGLMEVRYKTALTRLAATRNAMQQFRILVSLLSRAGLAGGPLGLIR